MSTPEHAKQIVADGIHTAVSYTYLTSASLAASTGFDIYDAYKLALVTGDNSLWILINPISVPPLWQPIVTGATTGSISQVTGSGGTSVTGGSGPVATVSSSVGAPPEAFFILSASNSALANANILSASGGSSLSYAGGKATISSSITVVAGAGGSSVVGSSDGSHFVVSSSIPLVQNLVGVGAVLITPPVYPSTTWIISGSGGGAGSVYVQGTGSIGVTGDGSVITPFIVSSSVIQVSGTGGTSVATGDNASRFVVSSSITQLTGAGGLGVSVDGNGYRWTISGSTGEVTSITGSGGSSVTRNGTVWTVSSSLPIIESLVGVGGVGVTNNGTAYTVSSSIATVTASGGVSVVSSSGGYAFLISSSIVTVSGLGGSSVSLTPGSTNYVVSSSAPTIQALTGIGAAVVSNSGQAYTVSASVVTVAGAGGSTVTAGGGTTYTVSSSVGAPKEATYLVLNANGDLTQERVLTAGSGISFVDGGAGSTLTINGSAVTANVYKVTASYVVDSRPSITDAYLLVSASAHNITASLPAPTSGRVLVFKDLGSGSTFPWLIAPVSSAKIDTFSASYTWQSTFGSLVFVSDGTDWFIT